MGVSSYSGGGVSVENFFGLNLSLVLLMKVVFIKTHITLFFSLQKNEEIALPHEFFFCLSGISVG